MKSLPRGFLLALCCLLAAHADPTGARARLTIDSSPAGAHVHVWGGSLKGDLLSKPTPVVMAEVAPGRYSVTVDKPGYWPKEFSYDIAPGTNVTARVTLSKRKDNNGRDPTDPEENDFTARFGKSRGGTLNGISIVSK